MPLKDPIRPADIILPLLGTGPALFLLIFAAVVAPSFARMLNDFGGHLPVVTRLALTTWVPVTSGVLLLTVTWAPLAAGAPARTRRLASSVALMLGLGAGVLAVIAVYLPLFALAGTVK